MANKSETKSVIVNNSKHGGNAVYCLGVIGSAVYFIQNSDTLWLGIIGLLKALVWPAYVAYKLLESFYG